MKKIILVALCLMSLGSVWAQKRVGEFSVIPRVGLNMSNLGDCNIYTTENEQLKSRIRPDFMLGADVEYQLLEPLGVSIGAFYSRQGCRWPDFSEEYITDDKSKVTSSIMEQAYNLQYINIPVSAKLYANDFISFHAGVQAGILLDAKYHYVISDLKEPVEGDKEFTSETHNEKMQNMNSVVWSIPLGASLEYQNVIVDVQYSFPLSRFNKIISKGGNRVWTFSVGYRF